MIIKNQMLIATIVVWLVGLFCWLHTGDGDILWLTFVLYLNYRLFKYKSLCYAYEIFIIIDDKEKIADIREKLLKKNRD
jgi:hypothetical protein